MTKNNSVQVTYLGYELVEMLDGMVGVFEPVYDFSPVYTAVDYDSAKSWVRAYRDGLQWAVSAALH